MNVASRWIPLFLVGSALLAQAPPPPPPPAPPAPPAPMVGVDVPSGSRTEQRVEKLAQGSKLWVKNRNGAIRVTGWDRDEVSLTAQIRDSDKRRVDLVLQRRGQDLDIEAIFQQPSWSFGAYVSPRCEMTLMVPRKLQGHFRTTNGTITVEDVAGGIHLETTNGRITARNLDGWGEGIYFESTNGSIEVELGKASGELLVENSNGSLELKVPGAQVIEMTKHTAHLKVPGRSQTIRLETSNGSIRVK